MLAARPWDIPITHEQRVALPAASVAASDNASPRIGVLEITGRYSCVDFYYALPAEWWTDDILMRVSSTLGPITTVLDERRVTDAQLLSTVGAAATPTQFTGLLFSIRGKTCDKLTFEAFRGPHDCPAGLFYARAWGGDIGIYGDRNMRVPVDLFARPNQIITYAEHDPANPSLVFGPNPNGGRVAITGVQWTGELDTVQLTVRDEPIAGPNVTLYAAQSPAAGSPIVSDVAFATPIFSRRGSSIGMIASAALVGSSLSIQGFYE